MPKFRGSLAELKLAGGTTQLRERIMERVRDAIRGGTRAWLAATVERVPLYSGMARASLLSVARLVDGRIMLSPLKAASRIEAGERLGSVSFTESQTGVSVQISSRVPHYEIQDSSSVSSGRGSPSAPWKSFPAGAAAFNEYFRTVRFPRLNILSATTVRI